MDVLKKTITVFAPATVANVSCAFDIMGFALSKPGDIVKLTLRKGDGGVSINSITGDGGSLPKEADKNTAGFAVKEYLRRQGFKDYTISMDIQKGMPLGSGLGSSAASAAAALYGINRLFDDAMDERELLKIGLACERLACGSPHGDNIIPSILGGLVLIRSYVPLDYTKLPVPEGLFCLLIHPDVEVNTRDARRILPETVELSRAVRQWGNIASLVAALYNGDYGLLSRSLEDLIIEPERSKRIPHFDEMRDIAMKNGALNLSISGSGPSVFSFFESVQPAESAALAIQRVFKEYGIESDVYVSKINKTGPEIIR